MPLILARNGRLRVRAPNRSGGATKLRGGILQLVCADPKVQEACTTTLLLAPVVAVAKRIERSARGRGVSLVAREAWGLPSGIQGR